MRLLLSSLLLGAFVCLSIALTPRTQAVAAPQTTQPATKLAAANPSQTCKSQEPVVVLFKKPSDTKWLTASAFTASNVATGDEFEVSCFTRNGSSLLSEGQIELTPPEGKTTKVSTSSELKNYRSFQAGTHIFRCSSTAINQCGASDAIVIKAGAAQPSSEIGVGGPTNEPAKTPPPEPTKSSCDTLEIISGNHQHLPAKVTFKASGSDNRGQLQRYRFFFGDGQQIESDKATIEHTYQVSGNFTARVEVKDSQGNWKSTQSCQTTVEVKSTPIEQHKAACSDVQITAENNGVAPANVSFKITGFDNKGELQHYRLDLGNGTTKDNNSTSFEHTYDQAGTYAIRAYVQDTQGNWLGGTDGCKKTLYINTQPLTQQPETGTPTILTMIGLLSGATGLTLHWWNQRRQFKLNHD